MALSEPKRSAPPPVHRHVGRALLVAVIGVLALLAFGPRAWAEDPTPTPTPPAPTDGSDADRTAIVSGILNDAGTRLADVTVRALDASGAEVESTASDSDGRWELRLTPGKYVFEVAESTLPDDVTVQSTVERTVKPGPNPVIFSFGEARSTAGVSFVERFIVTAIDGIRFGLVIAIAGIGLSLIYGTTGLTNFAHGELVTLGAVAAWVFNVTFGIQLIPATALAIVVGIGIGFLNNAALWAPLRRRRTGLIPQLVVSIALAIVLRYLILIFFSDRNRPFDDYQAQTQLEFGPLAITPVNLATIIVSLLVLVGVALLLQKTRIGKAMRAVADNRDLAAASGINVERVISFVWALGGGLAALGGVLFGLSELSRNVQWEMGFKLLLLMFAGIILGGIGTAYGALVGCIIVGLMVQLSTLWISPDLKYIGGLAVLIVILVVRPQGILGSRARIG